MLKTHHLADLVQQFEFRIGNEPLPRQGRLFSFNIRDPVSYKQLWTSIVESIIPCE